MLETAGKAGPPHLSIIIPVYNEVENIPLLCERLFAVTDALPGSVEIIAVDDGSTDGSIDALRKVAETRHDFKVVRFRRNFGQTAAIMAGIDTASGDVFITLDADLQNDPADIPLLLEILKSGADVVSGWRKDRQDAAIRRNLVSRIANRIISRISGVHLHDYGCTLKAYRREVMDGIRLYGEMHRFVPIYASWMGAKVVEVPVRHHPRRFGKSKYGIERTLKVILDLMVVKFMARYLVKPIYVFGSFGILSLVGAVLTVMLMIFLKLAYAISMILTPLPVLATMLTLIGVISIFMGILAEIMIRTYFEAQGRLPYAIRETINIERV